jgi:hypothetical protein
MQVVHTAGLPPYQGRMYRAITGWTWKRRKALRKMEATKRGMKLKSRLDSRDGWLL